MRILLPSLLLLSAFLAVPAVRAQSLLENGKFNDPSDPLKGWIVDYAWTGNSYYVGNKAHVSVGADGARKSVVNFTAAGDGGEKMESHPFPLEPGFRYVCNLEVKGEYRLYFAGYQWAPGVHPHPNPELSELRLVYQSKATVSSSPGWKAEKFELPGVAISPTGLEHLKKVKFLTVYIFMAKAGSVDNVVLTKVADPAMKF